MERVYTVKKSQNSLPLVFDSPHSGKVYPENFGYHCDFETLQRAEDHDVEDLFAYAPEIGAALLSAEFPRSYIDPNRAIDDIDENLLAAPWPRETLGEITPTARSDSGIGLIRRLVRPGEPVYNRALSPEEIQTPIFGLLRHHQRSVQRRRMRCTLRRARARPTQPSTRNKQSALHARRHRRTQRKLWRVKK